MELRAERKGCLKRGSLFLLIPDTFRAIHAFSIFCGLQKIKSSIFKDLDIPLLRPGITLTAAERTEVEDEIGRGQM
jgi:hypothetical protein